MIARYWRGWTKSADADAYERLLKDQVLRICGKSKVIELEYAEQFGIKMPNWPPQAAQKS